MIQAARGGRPPQADSGTISGGADTVTRTGWARTDRQGGLRVRAGAAVVVVLLGVSACSGPDADAAQGTPTPSVGPAAQGTATQGTATPGATDPAGTPSVTPTSPAP